MNAKLSFAVGAAAVVLTVGTAVLAADVPAPSPAAKPAQTVTITAPAKPDAPNMMWASQGDGADKTISFQRFDGNGGGMMRGTGMMTGRNVGGFSHGHSFRGFDGHRAVSPMLPFVCFFGVITMLLVWTALVLIIIALWRHLFSKRGAMSADHHS